MMRSTPFEQIHAVLMAEQAALLSGDIESLDQIADRKDRATQRLAETHLAPAEMERLRSITQRNSELLRMVADAIKTARALVTRDARGPQTLAYSADGTRHPLQQSTRQLVQKA
ncbi:hypothetical protein ROE7235_01905 [Roseibaca ekhonensis]|jgi:hypothetical protein|uniref:Flagellar protein FlgN n=1 Tax=Roseinatronobacter ekhonensis TaxID=254356 RepID=A0A3B0M850_9RHOB|nr:hypothetical protein [Roseibaca ekhonensis]SUZ32151.1 hypothetical protein ROE7235_01905 [Roseibaca ekhonensis]